MKKLIPLLLVALCMLAACKKKDDDKAPSGLGYDVPTTYNFSNVSYKGQMTRIMLLDTLTKVINSAKTNAVTAAQLIAIYENTAGHYNFSGATSGYPQLKNKVANAALDAKMLALFDSVEANSPYAEPGVSSAWFITPKTKLDIAQMVQKTLIGGILYYRAVNDYLLNLETDDNSTVVDGQGTAMEHHFDEAFGYYGAPIDFGTYPVAADGTYPVSYDTDGDGIIDRPFEQAYFIASYSRSRDNASVSWAASDRFSFRTILMNAFLTGRAAISNKDYVTRDAQVDIIIAALEKELAATAVNYINRVKATKQLANPTDAELGNMYHAWGEGYGFVQSLQYSPVKTITNDQFTELEGYMGSKPADASVEDMTAAANLLKTIYGFSDFQAANLRVSVLYYE